MYSSNEPVYGYTGSKTLSNGGVGAAASGGVATANASSSSDTTGETIVTSNDESSTRGRESGVGAEEPRANWHDLPVVQEFTEEEVSEAFIVDKLVSTAICIV